MSRVIHFEIPAEDPERAELKEFQRSVCAMVPLPPGVAEYEDFLRKERDG